jgi:hypothetical protein
MLNKQVKYSETEDENSLEKWFLEEALKVNMETVKIYEELERNPYPKRCNDS